MKQTKAYLFSVFLIFLLSACKRDRLKDADVSKVDIPGVKLLRLDEDIFKTNPAAFEAEQKKLETKYNSFYNTFIFNVVNHGEEHDSVYKALKFFVTDRDMKNVYDESRKVFTDEEINSLENQLTDAFKHLRYHLPSAEIPKQYVSFISGFNYSITSTDSTLGIGLDMYLGSANKYYQMLQWPQYKARCMRPEYIASDAMKGWLTHLYDKNEQLNNLLNHMIFYGKLYYLMDAALPEVQDSIKIQYSTAQVNYCRANEKNLWAYFTQNERLYKNDLKELAPYISDGPFTSAISKDCPPRIAAWTGWQIVRSYMNKHKDVSVEQLMNESDAQKILSQSKYKP